MLPERWTCLLLILFVHLCVKDTGVGATRSLLTVSCDNEDINLKALDELHSRLDDDRDGLVETLETSQFIEDEFHSVDKRRRADNFHARDANVNKDEFRKKWRSSAVYNWTEADMLHWLVELVQLPQYAKAFEEHDITGRCLPRLAVNWDKILLELGINSRVHRKKLKLRSLDVVLFGVPAAPSSFWMRVSLIVVTAIAIGVGYYGIRSSQQRKLMENQLRETSQQLNDIREIEEKLANLQASPQPSIDIPDNASVGSNQEEKSDTNGQLEAELRTVKSKLAEAEHRLRQQTHSFALPYELAKLLHETYKREHSYYQQHLAAAKRRLQDSEEAYQKIDRKIKRSTFIPSSIRLTGGRSLQELERSIVEAKSSFHEVLNECNERQERWRRIEVLCSVSVTSSEALGKMSRKKKEISPLRKPLSSSQSSHSSAHLGTEGAEKRKSSSRSSSTERFGPSITHAPVFACSAKPVSTSPRVGQFQRSTMSVPANGSTRSLKESVSTASLPPLSNAPPNKVPSSRSKEPLPPPKQDDISSIPRTASLPLGFSLSSYQEHVDLDESHSGSAEEDGGLQMGSIVVRRKLSQQSKNGTGSMKKKDSLVENAPESEV